MVNNIILQLAEWAGVVAVTMILALSPAFKRRPLIFKYPRREATVALSLGVLVGVAIWLVYSLLPQSPASATGSAFVFTMNDLARQAGIAVLLAVPVVAALLIRRQPLLSTGLNQRVMRPSLYMGFSLAVITIFLRNKIYTIIYGGIIKADLYFLVAALLIAFAEEFIFRGFIQPRVSAWIGERWGWVASAALYAVCCLPQQFAIKGAIDWPALALQLAILFGSGLVLGWIMRKSGNILAPWLYHAIAIWVTVL
jgi:membrane protease YdiL (CAAX protease family)